MAKKLVKKDLVMMVAEQCNVSKVAANAVMECIFELIKESVTKGVKVEISGFGSFERRLRKAKPGMNPKTKEKVTIPATHIPKFKPYRGFMEMVKKGDIDHVS